MRLGLGGGTSVAPGLPCWIQALGLGVGREEKDGSWILSWVFLCVPPGEEDHWLLRLVLLTLSGCPQNLSCMIWDHIPIKGGYPGALTHRSLAS